DGGRETLFADRARGAGAGQLGRTGEGVAAPASLGFHERTPLRRVGACECVFLVRVVLAGVIRGDRARLLRPEGEARHGGIEARAQIVGGQQETSDPRAAQAPSGTDQRRHVAEPRDALLPARCRRLLTRLHLTVLDALVTVETVPVVAHARDPGGRLLV